MRSTEGPEHVGAPFQRSSGAVARSSFADLEQTTDVLEMRERNEAKRLHTAFSRRCTAMKTQGRRSQEASNEVAKEFITPAQPCKRHSNATAQQCKRHSRTRRTIASNRTSHRELRAVCGGNDTAELANNRETTMTKWLDAEWWC